MIEDFGDPIAIVWAEIRPSTRGLVERALQTTNLPRKARKLPYDQRTDFELSRLLTALDDRVTDPINVEQGNALRHVADTCAAVLQEKTQSAEVFVQLVLRAEMQRDYKRIDSLADALTARFAPTEICELVRSQEVIVRALAQEALAQFPTHVLIGILNDPVDSEIGRDALRRQAFEYGTEEARQVLSSLSQMDMLGEDF